MTQEENKMFCRHGVPVDDRHFCNACHKDYIPEEMTYEQVIERFDDEIEGADYMLKEAERRQKRFMEKYRDKKSSSNKEV